MNNPVGIFDSGIGGLTVLKQLLLDLPNENFIYFADSKNAPYGPRTVEEITIFSRKIINFLLSKGCKLIIIACNTATAAAVYQMRKEFRVPIIGLEPAVKPACLKTRTNSIGVLATEGTFRGEHFKTTSQKYRDYIEIHIEIPKELVELAERAEFAGENVDKVVAKYVNPLKEKNVDYIVLGCTHYPFFYSTISRIAGNDIKVIDSSEAISRRAKDLLMTLKLLRKNNENRKVQIFSSDDKQKIVLIADKFLPCEKEIEGNIIL